LGGNRADRITRSVLYKAEVHRLKYV
jgi:hypothetical protein